MKMSKSEQVTYAKRFLSFKTEEARLRDFEKIVISQILQPNYYHDMQ